MTHNAEVRTDDLAAWQAVETINLSANFNHLETPKTKHGMPQDIRISADGVHVLDFVACRQTVFIATGVGAHGLYPSRDDKNLYVANRDSNKIQGSASGLSDAAVIDFATQKVPPT
ncbi:hypothetical protein [Rhodoferax sp.]|uniref:hypothetical protein n=1 Tax=Rhodoferax sp. TaxID=50421 RepID=UPI0025E26AAD|nr:hypothetical protein [Rhodoferax sp.]